MRKVKAAVMVDEINSMNQFHRLGIEGIQPWKSFFEALEKVLKLDYPDIEMSCHIYGAIVPRYIDHNTYFKRKRFFEALERDGIQVHRGFCVKREDGLTEKAVDVMLALDLYESAQRGYDLLIVFSGDADVAPAIKRAQKIGSKVVAVLSQGQKAKIVKDTADAIITLESLIELIPKGNIVFR
jgi:uncharacterized LabA/DUF88 family protein